jgi:hypothetical protein
MACTRLIEPEILFSKYLRGFAGSHRLLLSQQNESPHQWYFPGIFGLDLTIPYITFYKFQAFLSQLLDTI